MLGIVVGIPLMARGLGVLHGTVSGEPWIPYVLGAAALMAWSAWFFHRYRAAMVAIYLPLMLSNNNNRFGSRPGRGAPSRPGSRRRA